MRSGGGGCTCHGDSLQRENKKNAVYGTEKACLLIFVYKEWKENKTFFAFVCVYPGVLRGEFSKQRGGSL